VGRWRERFVTTGSILSVKLGKTFGEEREGMERVVLASAVAVGCKYCERNGQFKIPVRLLKGKLREAPQNVLRDFYLRGALALEKLAPKATRLFQFAGFFQWKAEKSSNKHPLSEIKWC
jgi:hypothetical protein